MELTSILKRHFHYEKFRDGQEEVISSVLSGHHTLAMLPTGTGKSLCYQLPGYLLKGPVLIVSPLLSLMQDQVEQMKMKGEKRVVAINSFLTQQQKKTVLINLGKYKFVFISPEMLGIEMVLKELVKQSISLFVIDEAHCISQWGYDFRPDYLKLGDVRKKLGNPVTLALTATANSDVRKDIKMSLGLKVCKEIIYSVDRPNITIKVEKVADFSEKLQRVHQYVHELKGPGIIYFSSKRLAEQTATYLQDHGNLNVMAYHGGMEQEQRILIQQQFLNGQLDVICATSAFGMGINKEDIRYIIHYHMPLQIESYLQEIGRAGRDGEGSLAILLYTPGDEFLATQLSEAELPTKEQIQYLDSLTKGKHEILLGETNQEEWRKSGGFTETQWRIIIEFFDMYKKKKIGMDNPFSALILFIEERLMIKRSKIASMTQWIHSNQCRRNSILTYFAEMKREEDVNTNCCDCCGIELSHFLASSSSQKEFSVQTFHWKQHLSEILLN